MGLTKNLENLTFMVRAVTMHNGRYGRKHAYPVNAQRFNKKHNNQLKLNENLVLDI